jgi:hypothetical protein
MVKKMMKKILIAALVLGTVIAFALPVGALTAPDNITLTVPGQAPVLFNHAAHVAQSASCKDCHHYGVGNGQCDGCHGKTSQVPTLAVAYESCKSCHTPAGSARTKAGKKKR